MISGDKNILTPGGSAYERLQLQRSHVEKLDVYVWPQVHTWREISDVAQKNAYDVVTAQDPFWRGFLAWRIATRMGAKLNLQVHTDLSAQNVFRRVFASALLHRADSIRVVSKKIQKQVRLLGVRASISLLPIYIDVQEFKKLVPQPHTQKTILWIGRFEAEKDPLHAVQVLKEVRAKGVDARLVMLGSGSLESTVRQSAQGLPVEFPGWQDPKSYLQTADVVLCTSKHESWGASIVEALASGVSVVAPDVGVAQEAGAYVVEREELSAKVVWVLIQRMRSTLRLHLPSAEEWSRHWRETLR